MASKSVLREKLAVGVSDRLPERSEWGRIAERLRRTEAYRQAHWVFVGPADILSQIRINVLMDGKELIMPSPALKEGFFLCRPSDIPFARRSFAVSFKGLAQFGYKIGLDDFTGLDIGLFVADTLAWDQSGNRLGDGMGFFDLSWALLKTLGAMSDRGAVLGVGGRAQCVDLLPVDPWDVKMDGMITEDGIDVFANDQIKGVLFWEQLPAKRIRKMSLLWKLSNTITPCSS
ncbi:MAG: 5-formyltetrahydrofolate cyclo-ligase [Thermodesulfobacteriota bacterium]|nr:5-formyltetrahydrofolate cyclo-ligase [Thermodesulfobacteriota bacterium]